MCFAMAVPLDESSNSTPGIEMESTCRPIAFRISSRFTTATPQTPEQTFNLRSGICFDAAIFIKRSLDHIDSSYEARIVFIENRPSDEANHYVCSFKRDGKLLIMDYGTGLKNEIGTHGPFDSLEDYLKY